MAITAIRTSRLTGWIETGAIDRSREFRSPAHIDVQ